MSVTEVVAWGVSVFLLFLLIGAVRMYIQEFKEKKAMFQDQINYHVDSNRILKAIEEKLKEIQKDIQNVERDNRASFQDLRDRFHGNK